MCHHKSATDMSLAFCATLPGWWMKSKTFTIHNPWSFLTLHLLNHLKICITYRNWHSKFPWRGRKLKYAKKKNWRYMLMAFLGALNIEDLPQGYFSCILYLPAWYTHFFGKITFKILVHITHRSYCLTCAS